MSRLARPLLVLAWLVPAGVLVQAILAGQGLFRDAGLIGLHGGIGHGVLLLAVLLVGLVLLTRVGRGPALLAATNVVLLVAQTGMGYAGRRSGVAIASSLHVSLGAVLLASTTVLAVLVTQRVLAGGRPAVGASAASSTSGS
jgi:hypothetical protein